MTIRQATTENFVLKPVQNSRCNDHTRFILQIVVNQPPFVHAADCLTRTMFYFDPRFKRF